ncbi:MAG: hypothetical protein O6934_10790, partial [SAR324 cluster bacterium]|nr:hypothetical protein [SAR324 cluster bacterium]
MRLGAAADEELADRRLAVAGHAPDARGIDRDVAPAQEALALGGHGRLDDGLARRALRWALGEERHAHGVIALGGQLEAERRGLLAHERVGHLEQH